MNKLFEIPEPPVFRIVNQRPLAASSGSDWQQQYQRLFNAKWTAIDTNVYISGFSVGSAAKSSLLATIQRANVISDTMKTVQRLRSFKTWKNNWDGEGAPIPDKNAIDSAVLLFGFLSSSKTRTRVALDALGKPMIFLSRDEIEVEIIVTNEHTIEFSILGNFEDGAVDVHFNGIALPDRLKASLVHSRMISA